MGDVVWTAEIIEYLLELFNRGMGRRDIAREIGRKFHVYPTYGAVIGKLARLSGKDQYQTVEQTKQRREARLVLKQQQDAQPKPVKGPPKRPGRPKAKPAVHALPDVTSDSIGAEHVAGANKGCSIYDLTSDTCHWPYGDNPPFIYCGAQTVAGAPYCYGHCETAAGHAFAREVDDRGFVKH